MNDVEAINRLLEETVPFGRAVGARVIEVGPERSVVVLPGSPDKLNHVGTVHAVAQFGVGEVAAGTLILAAFSDLQAAGYAPVIADVAIHYRKAARGELRATATLADAEAEQARIRSQIATDGKAWLDIPVQIATADGTITTELETTWVLLAPRS